MPTKEQYILNSKVKSIGRALVDPRTRFQYLSGERNFGSNPTSKINKVGIVQYKLSSGIFMWI